jgi:ATP-dependent exoDNAse (exonuclease V) beta subunit
LDVLISTIEDLLRINTPNDIFILARSVNIRSSKSPLKQLTNKLSAKKIPVYMPQRDEEKLSADDINGKISIITFHQSKGLERKNVIIWGFDSFSYREEDKNAYYVALTRSLSNLILVQSRTSCLIPPFTRDDISELTQLKTPLIFSPAKETDNEEKDNLKMPHIGITDMLHHLNSTLEYNLTKQLEWECLSPPTRELDIPMYVDSKVPESKENISEYNGIIIPYYYEYVRAGGDFPSLDAAMRKFLSIESFEKNKSIVTEDGQLNTEKIISMINKHIETFKHNFKSEHQSAGSISHLLRAIVLWNSLRNNIIYKFYQIKQFTWISNDALRAAYGRLHQHVQNQSFHAEQHYQIQITFRTRYRGKVVPGFYIHGYIDAITQSPNQTTIWEFKTTKTITQTHKLQLALYTCLFLSARGLKRDSPPHRYLLYNIYTDELLELKTTDLSILMNIFKEILYAHINKDPNQLPLDVFIDTCKQVIEAVKTQKSTASIGELSPPVSKSIKHDKSILKSFEDF